MLRISLDNPQSGWAYLRLSDGTKEVLITGPYSPVDVLRDLIDAVQSLKTASSVECCWSQEPGELHWNLRRQGEDLEIKILNYADIGLPGQHRGEAEPVFKAQGKWLAFARQLLGSLERIRTELGPEGYERAWRHPFPKEAQQKLHDAIHN